ncbi:hypothetical protein [Desulfitobacterium sp.]|uniref:hypothetical protein n=1 Tax=Desulfitobacterium sp. TaxID=49981 RepID=UPI002B218BEE|nr:hypothetical protein [Desulfitobacterium sp.]MEA4901589.1 hypothetical protein [Desulfitobacterium sp.]
MQITVLKNSEVSRLSLLIHSEIKCTIGCRYCSISIEDTKPFSLREVFAFLKKSRGEIREIHIITLIYNNAFKDLCSCIEQLRTGTHLPIIVSINPWLVTHNEELKILKSIGINQVSFSLIASTRNIETSIRPDQDSVPWWDICWKVASSATPIFGYGNVILDLGLGIGETEQQALAAIQKAKALGVLVSISPLPMEGKLDVFKVSAGKLFRILVGQYLLEKNFVTLEQMQFDNFGQVIHFGILPGKLIETLNSPNSLDRRVSFNCSNLVPQEKLQWFFDQRDTVYGPDLVKQLCSIDWAEAWITQRRVIELENIRFNEDEIEGGNGSIYKMIAEIGEDDLEDED